jgi:hypothetical protein
MKTTAKPFSSIMKINIAPAGGKTTMPPLIYARPVTATWDKPTMTPIEPNDTLNIIKTKVAREIGLAMRDFLREIYSYGGSDSGITREAVRSYFTRYFYMDGRSIATMMYLQGKKPPSMTLLYFDRHIAVESDMLNSLGIPSYKTIPQSTTPTAPFFLDGCLHLKKAPINLVFIENASRYAPLEYLRRSVFYHTAMLFDIHESKILSFNHAISCFQKRILQLTPFGASEMLPIVNSEDKRMRMYQIMKNYINDKGMKPEPNTAILMDFLRGGPTDVLTAWLKTMAGQKPE